MTHQVTDVAKGNILHASSKPPIKPTGKRQHLNALTTEFTDDGSKRIRLDQKKKVVKCRQSNNRRQGAGPVRDVAPSRPLVRASLNSSKAEALDVSSSASEIKPRDFASSLRSDYNTVCIMYVCIS